MLMRRRPCCATEELEAGMLSFDSTLMLLAACCAALLVGFSWRERRWGPWLMLAAITSLLLLMAYSIINLLS